MHVVSLLCVCLCFASRVSQAALEQRSTTDRVLLVHEQRQDLLIRELVTRVRGELVAAGFRVDVAPRAAIADARAEVEATAAADVVATFAILRDVAGETLEVWLNDRLTHKTTVRSLSISDDTYSRDQGADVLAVQVVELLRASLLELIAHTSTPVADAPKPAAAVTHWVQTPPPTRAQRPFARVAMGVGLLQSLDRVPSSLVPWAAVQAELWRAWSVRLLAAGFGTQPLVDSPAGAARLQQSFAVAEAAYCFTLAQRGCLDLSVGAGAFHLRADGQAMSPYQPRTPAAASAAMTAGVGVSWDLPWHTSVGAHTQALLLWPQPMVRIAGVDVGRIGRPSLLTGVNVAIGF